METFLSVKGDQCVPWRREMRTMVGSASDPLLTAAGSRVVIEPVACGTKMGFIVQLTNIGNSLKNNMFTASVFVCPQTNLHKSKHEN